MKVEEYPTVTCTKCGCKYSFDKDDIIENCEYIETVRCGFDWYDKIFNEEEYVECPVCGTKHIISSKERKDMISKEEYENM